MDSLFSIKKKSKKDKNLDKDLLNSIPNRLKSDNGNAAHFQAGSSRRPLNLESGSGNTTNNSQNEGSSQSPPKGSGSNTSSAVRMDLEVLNRYKMSDAMAWGRLKFLSHNFGESDRRDHPICMPQK